MPSPAPEPRTSSWGHEHPGRQRNDGARGDADAGSAPGDTAVPVAFDAVFGTNVGVTIAVFAVSALALAAGIFWAFSARETPLACR